jgi:signal recognition particle GTPase
VSEVNRFLDQFRQMQQMMKKVARGGRPPSLPGMFR